MGRVVDTFVPKATGPINDCFVGAWVVIAEFPDAHENNQPITRQNDKVRRSRYQNPGHLYASKIRSAAFRKEHPSRGVTIIRPLL